MVRATAEIGAALNAYRPVDAGEAADVERIRAALDADCFSRTAPLHVTASALVVHPESQRVLLRWHPRMQQWMQVGGHFDPGESDPVAVARREAREETGLTDLAAPGPGPVVPVQIVIVPVPAFGDEAAHEHADLRYVLVTDRPDDIRPESSAAQLAWTPLSSAGAQVAEDNLRVFLRRAALSLR